MKEELFMRLMRKYIITDENEKRRILESMKKARSITLGRGVLYEIDNGVFIGMSKDGKLQLYLC